MRSLRTRRVYSALHAVETADSGRNGKIFEYLKKELTFEREAINFSHTL